MKRKNQNIVGSHGGNLIKSFCGGVQGGQFFQKAPPLAAGGKKGGKQ
jgi:hypothetical protein